MAKARTKVANLSGAPGADSSTEVVHTVYGKTLLEHASGLFGNPPRFWGRYFKTPEQQGGTQYNPKTEHAALAAAGCDAAVCIRQASDWAYLGWNFARIEQCGCYGGQHF